MIQEFKDFVNKGGVFEAAIGPVFALAFKPIIDSLVADVILQARSVAEISATCFSFLIFWLCGAGCRARHHR